MHHYNHGGTTINHDPTRYHVDHDDVTGDHFINVANDYHSGDHVYVFTADELHDLVRTALNGSPYLDEPDDVAAWLDNYTPHHKPARNHDPADDN